MVGGEAATTMLGLWRVWKGGAGRGNLLISVSSATHGGGLSSYTKIYPSSADRNT